MLKKLLKFTAINVLVAVLLLYAVNLGLIVLYKIYRATAQAGALQTDNERTQRDCLPNYKNIKWAQQHFTEYYELPSQYKSYIGWRRLRYSGSTINIDENGIRLSTQHKKANENSPLVIFLGGSTMWGMGVDDANTIPSLFSEAAGGEYRTLNYGEIAYRAFQDYLFLQFRMNEGVKPDIVVSYSGVNESYGFRSGFSASAHSREGQIAKIMQGQDKINPSPELSLRSFFIGPIEAVINRLKPRPLDSSYEYDFSPERTEKVARALLDAWSATKSLAEKSGAKYICVLQPNAGVGNPHVEHIRLDENSLKPYRQLYPAVLRLLHSAEYEHLLDNFIDMTGIFDGSEIIYIDWCHVSPNGNKIVAQKLLEHINTRIK